MGHVERCRAIMNIEFVDRLAGLDLPLSEPRNEKEAGGQA